MSDNLRPNRALGRAPGRLRLGVGVAASMAVVAGFFNVAAVHALTTPTLVTQASPSVPAGGEISDQATLSGGSSPTGTITFELYGPGNTACTGSPTASSMKPVVGNGIYPSDPFTTSLAGTYRWTASYSGDANNNPVGPTSCSDPAESVVVTKADPTLATQASPTVPAGGTVHDTATLAGGSSPTGTITFRLFGPNDSACAAVSPPTSIKTVNGNADYASDPFTVSAVGTYKFTADYSGDANNNPVASGCTAANESVTVTQAGPSISTQASGPVPVGGDISDTATLTGGASPTGTITFVLHGPNDSSCAGSPATTSTKTVNGNGNYTSDPFTTSLPGTYRWVATYSGDTNNTGVGPTACSDPNEAVDVTTAQPLISTTASASTNLGGSISDTATLSGGFNPTGTITFVAYGPNDPSCSAVVFTSTVTVSGNGSYPSGGYTPTAGGTYRWVAAYSGDSNNNVTASGCADASESVDVTVPVPPPFHPGIVGAPSVAVSRDGSTQMVFWREAGGHLFEAWYTSGYWYGPIDITGSYFGGAEKLNSPPSATVSPDGTVLVFWEDDAGDLVEGWSVGSHWYGPVNLTVGYFGGRLPPISAPSAAVTPDGTQTVYWRNAANHVVEAWYAGGRWNGPIDMSSAFFGGATLGFAPSAVVTPDGSQQLVFWYGPGGATLNEAWYAGGHWNGPLNLTTTFFGGAMRLGSKPSAAVTADGTQLVFWEGAGGHLDEAWFSGGHWYGPVDQTASTLGGVGILASAPSVAVMPHNTEQVVFWLGTDSKLWEAWYTNRWFGPVDFG